MENAAALIPTHKVFSSVIPIVLVSPPTGVVMPTEGTQQRVTSGGRTYESANDARGCCIESFCCIFWSCVGTLVAAEVATSLICFKLKERRCEDIANQMLGITTLSIISLPFVGFLFILPYKHFQLCKHYSREFDAEFVRRQSLGTI